MNTNRIPLWIARLDGLGGGTVHLIKISLQEMCKRLNQPDAQTKYFTQKEFAANYLSEGGYINWTN
tara:strand:- start:371 stop:568 length:198 start_codon:yes stop_codon:yes gene_type:complete